MSPLSVRLTAAIFCNINIEVQAIRYVLSASLFEQALRPGMAEFKTEWVLAEGKPVMSVGFSGDSA